MTNEEAVAYIQEWLKDEYALNFKDRKVLNMAVKALEQEPCEDYISREDALMCLTGEFSIDEKYDPAELVSMFSKRIKKLPFVQSKQKTGHWVQYEPEHHRCSECGKNALIQWSPSKRDNVDVLTNHCPNCGSYNGGNRDETN